MTLKERLLQEIESTPDSLLAILLNFLRFLKQQQTTQSDSLHPIIAEPILRGSKAELSPEALVLQTLTQLLATQPQQPISQWPEIILTFTGIPDFPAFESYRDELLPPREPEIF